MKCGRGVYHNADTSHSGWTTIRNCLEITPDSGEPDLGSSEPPYSAAQDIWSFGRFDDGLSGKAAKCERLVIPTDGNAELRMNRPRTLP